MRRYAEVEAYIVGHWDETVRYQPREENGLLALPYPFTVPCMHGAFNEMYYWDTYFTNKGLLLSGRIELAKQNCENIAHLIRTYGYMPNGSRTFYIGRSQPPYFALMIADIDQVLHDDKWLSDMFAVAKTEYDFWMTKRLAPNGLNRYGSDYPDAYYPAFLQEIASRIVLDTSRDVGQAGRDYVAEAESGWDFNPRFGGYCTRYNPVDLNSLLYRYEILFADFSDRLGLSPIDWKTCAAARAERMKCMEDDTTGVLYDYNYVDGSRSPVLSAASFWPYWTGLKSDRRGIPSLLERLELPYGITATEAVPGNYQWGYGKAWAPITLVAMEALDRLECQTDALRIARKYMDLIADNYTSTGGLWEKYDAVTGKVVHACEYETPEMLGWTAGAYLEAWQYWKDKASIGLDTTR